MFLFPAVPFVDLCSVNVAFPGHTQLLFALNGELKESLSFHSVNGSKSQNEGPSLIFTFKECLVSHYYSIKSSISGTLVSYLLVIKINEPVHDISNNVVCATSKASDQPAHKRSLIRAFARLLNIILLLSF